MGRSIRICTAAPSAGTGTGSGSEYRTNAISAVIVNSGNNNTFSGNIIDLGPSGAVAVGNRGYDSAEPFDVGMSAKAFTGNILIASFTGSLTANASGERGYA